MPAIGWRNRRGTGASASSPRARCSGTRAIPPASWRWSWRAASRSSSPASAISEVGPGELVGEAAAFIAGEKRTAGVRATGPTRLLVLPQAGLAALRREQHRSDVYDVLLDRALVGARRERIEATLARLSAAAGQVPRARRSGDRVRARDARASAPSAPRCPRRRARRCACCRSCRGRRRTRSRASRRRWLPTRVAEGDALVVEGERGRSAVPARRGAAGGVSPGAGGARPAAGDAAAGRAGGNGRAAARQPAQRVLRRGLRFVGRMRSSATRSQRLRGEAGRLLREALLCALRSQLRSIGSQLAAAGTQPPRRRHPRPPARRLPGRGGRRAGLSGRLHDRAGGAGDAAVPRRGRAGAARSKRRLLEYHPLVDHRRRRGDRDALRLAAHHLRRLHRVRPLPRLHRGLHPPAR